MAGGFVSTNAPLDNQAGARNYTFPLIVLTTLFFMWGFITCMNDILIPFLKGIFNLTPAQAGLIQSAFLVLTFLCRSFIF